MVLRGKFVKGYGSATCSVAFQLPLFRKEGLPNTEGLIGGTLNTDISPVKFSVVQYDYFYKNIENGSNRLEDFGFITIDKIVHKGSPYENPGYLYFPYSSPHFDNKRQVEVVAVKLANKENGDRVDIYITKGKLVLTK